MTCIECEKIRQKNHIIYEDDKVTALLVDKPATAGHIELMAKEHFPILEKVPDEVVQHMFFIANKISMACFEVLQAHGTNLIIRNGIAAGQRTNHAKLHIIPRTENDGLNFEWPTVKIDDDEMSTVHLQLEAEANKKEEAPQAVKEEKKKEILEESYLTKQLERIP